ncbi:hypothetical protein BDY24DRAFT_376092 [Mrakia frigida]|uniref:uncharacterized protein n=1 Tax=Mrakia frigida TaxID=29902 RepID=UPI003FCC271B
MCCNAKWKREIVPDHKFDFLNVQEYHSTTFFTRLRYVWLYIMVLITVGVYCANIYTAVTMLVADGWQNSIFGKCVEECAVKISVDVGKWIFVGCIIFSFLLLGYETHKARKVVASRDISYAFTNVMANGYYSLRSYPHFCFFCQINNSTKKTDDFAFFIFFTFKGWKHLLLADAPRQVISALTLYSFLKANNFQTDDLSDYYEGNWVTATLLVSMIFTVIVFAADMVLLVSAAILYVPLLCYIQGNLKEYCCHKIDKRIAELIKRKQRQRIARNAAMEKRLAAKNGTSPASGGQGSYTHQPTLPNVSLDEEDEDMSKPFGARGAEFDGAGGAYGGGRAGGRGGDQDEKYWAPDMPPGAEDYHGYGPPPMPMYQASPAASSYQPPSRNPSYPLHSQLPLQQQRLPDSYASSSTLGSYDLHQPPLDYNNNNQSNYYPQQSSNNPYPSSQDQLQQQHDLTRSYSPSQSLYTSPPPPQQPLDYYSNDVSGQHRRNLTQESLTSSENGGAMVYASEQGGVAGMARTREEERYYASPPPRGGSMYALDSDAVAGGSGGGQQQRQQSSTEGQGYPADYKALYRP